MVEGRSKRRFKAWLAQRPQAWRERVEVVAMDTFTGFKSATAEELPEAIAVMDPFHVVHLDGDAFDECRRRVQQDTRGHRGCRGDQLYSARRTRHTGVNLLTEKQTEHLEALFDGDEHVEVEPSRAVYQAMIAAYRDPDRASGRLKMRQLIDSLASSVPATLREVRKLGRTLVRRAEDIPAYVEQPATSNGPTEAINGRLELLRGSALGFATSPTTSPDPSWRPAASDPDYTLEPDGPVYPKVLTGRWKRRHPDDNEANRHTHM